MSNVESFSVCISKRNDCMAELYKAGATVTGLARKFGLAYSSVRRALVACQVLSRAADFPLSRFETKFSVTPGCWPWHGSMQSTGYGAFHVKGKYVAAHRFAYAAYVGPIADGLLVLHSCDNPICVNPDHLRLGTDSDNTADKVARNRCNGSKGEKNGSAKLTEGQVREIFHDTRSSRKVAADYGIDKATVIKIWNRKKWSHLNMQIN